MNRGSSFAALLEAMAAIVQSDGPRLSRALENAPNDALYGASVRHKCSGLLLWGITTLGVRNVKFSPLIKDLKGYCRDAMVRSAAFTEELEHLITVLTGARIQPVLLKGAARLYAREPDAHWSHRYDLDLLIKERNADRAVNALMKEGYEYVHPPQTVAKYRAFHHHLCPLERPAHGISVELHTALTPPDSISFPTDWNSLSPHFEPFNSDSPALRLNAYASALHHTIHGVGLSRLYDIVLVAREIQNDDSLVKRLARVFEADRIQPVPLLATLSFAAEMAGRPFEARPTVAAYAAWAIKREGLPSHLRTRSHFAEAWFANGGTLRGPATKFAFPSGHRAAPHRVAGRMLTSIFAATYAAMTPQH